MAASVLVFEAFIALFFGLVVGKLHPSDDWLVAVVLGVVSVLLSGMMRFRWAYQVGWALQVGFIGAGFLVTDMFVLGVVFAAIWWAGLHFGAKGEQIKAERMAAYEAAQARAAEGGTDGADEAGGAVGESDGARTESGASTSTSRPGVGAR
ncbi:MAG: DUF4233 domain-containing protein [Actinocrinis sp.]